jgi:membrane associated rhomboid family serine protease
MPVLRPMIPISDDNPARYPAFVTWSLIALCVVTYLWERSLGGDMRVALNALGFVPATYFSLRLTEPGDLGFPPAVTILTSMFLHGGILHLAGNMLYLWIFGNNVEDAVGHFRFLLFYVLCGVGAALAMAYIDPGSRVPMVGASGAISGVLAAYVLFFPRARVTVIVPLGIIPYPFALPAIWVIGFWFILQLVSAWVPNAAQPGTAWWAHLGGFAVGLLLAPILKPSIAGISTPSSRGPWER